MQERGVARVVVGLPLHMDGRAGKEARAAEAFAAALGEATGLPVDTVRRALDDAGGGALAPRAGLVGKRGKKRAALVDAVAATLILRTYLAKRG